MVLTELTLYSNQQSRLLLKGELKLFKNTFYKIVISDAVFRNHNIE